jgi:hypothetical protein
MKESLITINKADDDNYSINWKGLCNPHITKGFAEDVPFEP